MLIIIRDSILHIVICVNHEELFFGYVLKAMLKYFCTLTTTAENSIIFVNEIVKSDITSIEQEEML